MLLFIESAVIPRFSRGEMSTIMMCSVCALYTKPKAVARHIVVCYN